MMELIRKADALHAVLHNQGDAAVAAVQEIESILVPDDFFERAKELSMMPKLTEKITSMSATSIIVRRMFDSGATKDEITKWINENTVFHVGKEQTDGR